MADNDDVSKSTKSLTPAQRQAVRRLVIDLLAAKYEGSQVQMAAALQISQSMISDVIRENRGAGIKFVIALAQVAPEPTAKIMGWKLTPDGKLLGEHADVAVSALKSEGYREDWATWGVRAVYQFAPGQNIESVVALGRIAASAARTITELSGAPQTGAPNRAKRRRSG